MKIIISLVAIIALAGVGFSAILKKDSPQALAELALTEPALTEPALTEPALTDQALTSTTIASNETMPDSTEAVKTTAKYTKPPIEQLRSELTELQFQVTQEDATERPFRNPYNNEKRQGIYVDVVSGEPLFSSADKYDSKTGWPSFSQPLEANNIVEKTDYKLLFPRTEVRSYNADSHLGHLFKDGPAPTGLRYCMNSAAMRFIPKEELAEAGYQKYTELFEQ